VRPVGPGGPDPRRGNASTPPNGSARGYRGRRVAACREGAMTAPAAACGYPVVRPVTPPIALLIVGHPGVLRTVPCRGVRSRRADPDRWAARRARARRRV